jgi:hypothetical protein
MIDGAKGSSRGRGGLILWDPTDSGELDHAKHGIVDLRGERAGWHYGFAAAGVGMLIALATYLCAICRPIRCSPKAHRAHPPKCTGR